MKPTSVNPNSSLRIEKKELLLGKYQNCVLVRDVIFECPLPVLAGQLEVILRPQILLFQLNLLHLLQKGSGLGHPAE